MKKIILFVSLALIAATASTYANEYTDIAPTVAGCSSRDFVDARHMDSVKVSIVGQMYSPRCLMVKRGTSITIQASRLHPLQAMPPIRGRANPFASPFGRNFSQTRTLNGPGLYGFYCMNHGTALGEGMAGVILVED
jgi:plastocyanin